jgi:serine/threonine protein kinase/tetratricopeptide (TPR) repeat protein
MQTVAARSFMLDQKQSDPARTALSLVGQTVGHYRITGNLGAGGMGVVYLALDTSLERSVALKFLPENLTVSAGDKSNLRREARAASALDHPNVGVIHGLEETSSNHLFIVMQYYEGDTLAQRLSRNPIRLAEALDLAIQIARGLSAAHAANIVHRDVKPSNIIITKSGVAKIVDFGLARIVASASATQTISATGTLPYMAPEQILGESVDQRSDVWALAVILVQMMTGNHPFVRPTTTAMTFAILNQPPGALDLVPAALSPILYRALSKKPEHRYSNAAEMLADLEAARAEILALPAQLSGPTHTHAITPRELKQFMQHASTPVWTTRGSHTTRWLALTSLAIILTAAVALLLPPSRERLAGLAYASTEKHIAVLPFTDSTNDPNFQPVAAGLMDSVTNELSNLEAAQHSLWVVPASVVRSRNVNDPATAFRDLGATMVVQGSIARNGPDVSLTVVLIDSKRLRQIGYAQLNNPSGDLASLQNQAVAHLASMLKISASGISPVPATTVASTAYESYLRALGFLQRYDKPGNPALAISELNSALAQNPRFALGYATLGEAFRLKFLMDHDPSSVELALSNCQKALALDSHLPSVHVTLGFLHSKLGKNDLALQEFQKVLDFNPRDADAVIGMSAVYEQMGRVTDAEANLKRALSLRPDYWDGYRALAEFYDRQKRPQDAIAQYRRIIELTPDNPEAYSDLGVQYMQLADADSLVTAEAALRKSIQLAPNYQAYANLGWLYVQQKRYDESAAATRKALALNDRDWRVWSNLQLAYTWLQDEPQMRAARAQTLSLLGRYATVNPSDAPAQSMLSMLYAEDKRRDKALAHAKSALALSPNDPSILADIAETHLDLGDRRRALQFAHLSLENGYTLSDLQQRPALIPLLADPGFSGKRPAKSL